ncbi:MAG: hypothetical protein ACPGJI_06295 [Kangiellaceae bacterium]
MINEGSIKLSNKVTFLGDDDRKNIPIKPLEFLKSLNGLTVFDIKGKNQNKVRVVTTLIHGNEPSGLIACHLWLKSNERPTTNVRIIFCNPEAAKTKPYFTNRYLSQTDDLNRFFTRASLLKDKDLNVGNQEGSVTLRAKQILSLIKNYSLQNSKSNSCKLEAVLDLHNTSGTSPAFAVAIHSDVKHQLLAEFFTDNMIKTTLPVGAIMEQEFNAPIVTIECGGANENKSHQVASIGIQNFFDTVSLFKRKSSSVKIGTNPLRITLTDDASVGFSNHPLQTTDITLRADIESLNNGVTPAGEFIGWNVDEPKLLFNAYDPNNIDQAKALFEIRGECIYTLKELQFYMVTSIPEIATKDCLFYVTLVT